MVRNPLNLIIAAYYSHKTTHGTDGWPELVRQRGLLSSVGIDEGLLLTLPFLERADINDGAIGPLFGLRTWDYDDESFTTIRVEDLVRAPGATLGALPALSGLQLPPDADFAFETVADGRTPGQTDDSSHYRSGEPDEWKEHALPALLGYVRTFFPVLVARYYPELALHGVDLDRPFYEQDELTRTAMTYAALSRHGTVIQRWKALAAPEADGWNARSAAAAGLLAGCASVADLGCGMMTLEKYLPPTTTYIPVDVVARDDRTVVVDFNAADLPVTAEGAALLGVLEYLVDVGAMLDTCRRNFRTLAVTYNCRRDDQPIAERRQHAWVNDFGEAEIEALFVAHGFAVRSKTDLGGLQILWSLA